MAARADLEVRVGDLVGDLPSDVEGDERTRRLRRRQGAGDDVVRPPDRAAVAELVAAPAQLTGQRQGLGGIADHELAEGLVREADQLPGQLAAGRCRLPRPATVLAALAPVAGEMGEHDQRLRVVGIHGQRGLGELAGTPDRPELVHRHSGRGGEEVGPAAGERLGWVLQELGEPVGRRSPASLEPEGVEIDDDGQRPVELAVRCCPAGRRLEVVDLGGDTIGDHAGVRADAPPAHISGEVAEPLRMQPADGGVPARRDEPADRVLADGLEHAERRGGPDALDE